ncbi:MAG: hypothetical protein LUP91_13335 [Methylococcaceae bacterium]|nr:hypothetical protein [Methylococcaceae bacterium]
MSQENPSPLSGPGRGFTLEGRTVDAGRPVEWIKAGWQLFVKNPGVWIAEMVIGGIILVVLGMIPVLGQLASNFLAVLFAAGLLLGCRSLAEGGELRVDHLFAGFKQNTGNLVMVGVYYLVGIVIIVGITFAIGGGSALSGALLGRTAGIGLIAGGFLLAMLVGLALFTPLAMAVWFAPPLVVFRNVPPLEAMKASFNVCLKNMVPFLVYGVILLVLCVIAAIPLMLGFLVLGPVLIGAHYASYMELFE